MANAHYAADAPVATAGRRDTITTLAHKRASGTSGGDLDVSRRPTLFAKSGARGPLSANASGRYVLNVATFDGAPCDNVAYC